MGLFVAVAIAQHFSAFLSMTKGIQYTLISLLVLGSLALTTRYTHLELAGLIVFLLAILTKGIRNRTHKNNSTGSV